MTAYSHHRGYKIYYDEKSNLWRYSDNNQTVKDNWATRPCGKCNQLIAKKGHDPCIANLPKVQNACCGHGDLERAYVQFGSGLLFSGKTALIIMRILKLMVKKT